MYSILPALVASVFLGYGVQIICTQGLTRIGVSFFVLCITSAFWQGTWAILFQVRSPETALLLIKFGYLLILFLPTSLYHFLTETSDRQSERRFVYASYGVASLLGVLLLSTDLFIAGYYEYFFGYYPKAGLLHPVHVLQTIIVVNRGLYITFLQQKKASPNKRIRLRLCIGAILIYFFAAIDYLCNYGFMFYPPGVIFIAISLSIITIAIVRYGLLNPLALAVTVAHEIRTPLLSIRNQAQGMNRYLPTLMQGYELAVAHGLCKPAIRPRTLEQLAIFGNSVTHEVDRTNAALDMMIASIKMDQIDKTSFTHYSMEYCLSEAIDRYTFDRFERNKVALDISEDFRFYGSDTLFTLVVFNLLKNALYAIKAAGKGTILISAEKKETTNHLVFTDTGTGIARDTLSNIFDAFFTTKRHDGTGVGLPFCYRVMQAFGGWIQCDSVLGEYTTFVLGFPPIRTARLGSPEHSLDFANQKKEASNDWRTTTYQE